MRRGPWLNPAQERQGIAACALTISLLYRTKLNNDITVTSFMRCDKCNFEYEVTGKTEASGNILHYEDGGHAIGFDIDANTPAEKVTLKIKQNKVK